MSVATIPAFKLTHGECAHLRQLVDHQFDGGDIRGLEDLLTFRWVTSVFDQVGWRDGDNGATEHPGEITLCARDFDGFRAFVCDQERHAVEYLSDCAVSIERAGTGDPDWRPDGWTIDEAVRAGRATLREAEAELGLVRGILAAIGEAGQ